MVRSINSVKTDDSFYSFFIHAMIMQALSDNHATRSRAAGATTQPCGWLQTMRSSVSDSVRLELGRNKSAIEIATLPPG